MVGLDLEPGVLRRCHPVRPSPIAHGADQPPPAANVAPFTLDASSLARHEPAAAIPSGCARGPILAYARSHSLHRQATFGAPVASDPDQARRIAWMIK
jgi:hypothetical protein